MIAIRTAARLGAAGLLFVAACGRDGDLPEVEDLPLEPAAPAEDTLPMTPPTAPLYVGVWAADPDWCGRSPGAGDPSPIALTEEEFVGYENRCRIGASVEGTEGGYQLELICEAEGVEYAETVELDIGGEMMSFRREDGSETVFVRCEEEAGE